MNAVTWTEDTIHATEHEADDEDRVTVCGIWDPGEPIGFFTDLDRVKFGRPMFEFYVSCRECRKRLGLSPEVSRPPQTGEVLIVAVREE